MCIQTAYGKAVNTQQASKTDRALRADRNRGTKRGGRIVGIRALPKLRKLKEYIQVPYALLPSEEYSVLHRA